MPLMDEFKEERDVIKKAPLKVKLQYFWDYYKWHTFAIIVISALVISLVYSFITKKDVVYYAAIINGVETNQVEGFIEVLNEKFQVDPKKQEVRLDSGYKIDAGTYDQTTSENVQKISIYMAASDIDNIIGDEDMFAKYAYLDSFMDLRDCLSPDQHEKYQNAFYYVDKAVIRKQREANEKRDYSVQITYPPADKPDEMEEPVPVGIYLWGLEEETKIFDFGDRASVIGVVRNTTRKEYAVEFIELWEEYVPEGQVIIPGIGPATEQQ